jgi:hypothetical protein
VAASALSASFTGVLSQQNESRQCCHLALGNVSCSVLLRTVVDKKNIGTSNVVCCSMGQHLAYHIRQLPAGGMGNIWDTRMEKTTERGASWFVLFTGYYFGD